MREPLDVEALLPLDDDVEPAVVEALEHVGDERARSELAHAMLVGEHETELALIVDALVDQLAVARLEDVQRNALRREQHNAEREEAELVDRPSVLRARR